MRDNTLHARWTLRNIAFQVFLAQPTVSDRPPGRRRRTSESTSDSRRPSSREIEPPPPLSLSLSRELRARIGGIQNRSFARYDVHNETSRRGGGCWVQASSKPVARLTSLCNSPNGRCISEISETNRHVVAADRDEPLVWRVCRSLTLFCSLSAPD